MRIKVPSINLREVDCWYLALMLFFVNMFCATIYRWTNYGNLAVLAVLLYFGIRNKCRLSKLNFCWIMYILIYPLFDYAFRSEYIFEFYIALNYATVIAFLFCIEDNLEKNYIVTTGIYVLAWIQVIGVLLNAVSRSLFTSIAWRILGAWGHAVVSFSTDSTMTAYFISIGVGIAFLKLFTFKNATTSRIIVHVCMFVVMLAGVILSKKRSFVIATIVAIAICIIVLYRKHAKKLLFWIVAFAVIVCIFAGISVYVYNTAGEVNLFGRMGATIIGFQSGEDVSNKRSVWVEYMNQWREGRELFGIGWESFKSRIASISSVPNGHNVYVQTLCETGYVGFSMFMILIIITLLSAWKNFRHYADKRDKYDDCTFLLSGVTFYTIVVFSIYSYFGNSIYDSAIFFPYFLLVGVSSLLTNRRKRDSENNS